MPLLLSPNSTSWLLMGVTLPPCAPFASCCWKCEQATRKFRKRYTEQLEGWKNLVEAINANAQEIKNLYSDGRGGPLRLEVSALLSSYAKFELVTNKFIERINIRVLGGFFCFIVGRFGHVYQHSLQSIRVWTLCATGLGGERDANTRAKINT